MSAQIMLEDMARKYAILAVKADKEGKVEDAITYYKKAIEVLSQIIVLYPESVARTAYEQMINEYKKRISHLEKILPATDSENKDDNEDI
ncbi:MAG: AAA family ATPase, partial [Saccharolobus sp.]